MGKKKTSELRAWVVTVDMGYGHQRATYPLKNLAEGGIITIGGDQVTNAEEKKLWNRLRNSYEFISRVKPIPVIGPLLFKILDYLQRIPAFYPIRDLSSPTVQVKLLTNVLKKGLCNGMMNKIREQPLPLVTSYLAPAIAADMAGYPRIYCIICDAEVSRAWVAENPRLSRIHYLVPCGRSVMRLKSYGVPDERIFLTGFPLPLEALGEENLDVLKSDMAQRLFYLDPNNRFWPMHWVNVTHFLGRNKCRFLKKRRLTITFGIGGAGAQKEIGFQIAKSLRKKMQHGDVHLKILIGTRPEVKAYFEDVCRELTLGSPHISLVYGETKDAYFRQFSLAMRDTDLLWTKPSELSFFCGLGIPIILAPTIGAQEEYNQRWLLEIQAGISQEDPQYTDQWLFDLLREGRLAESAWDGFLKARKYGTYKIREILATGTMARETSPLKR